MTKEVARQFGHLAERINEMGKRIDDLYSVLHQNNANDINVNAIGIDGLAEVVGEQNEALEDLATAITELENGGE